MGPQIHAWNEWADCALIHAWDHISMHGMYGPIVHQLCTDSCMGTPTRAWDVRHVWPSQIYFPTGQIYFPTGFKVAQKQHNACSLSARE
eukprot:scaffold315606_cov17-Tisochrysis_lutea.AAC.1